MTIKSILLTVTGAGAICVLATGGYFFMQPKNIKDLLIKEKLTPLDITESSTKNDDKWDKLVTKHNSKDVLNKEKINGKIERLKFSNIQDQIDKNKLKKECRTLLKKEITNNKERDKINAHNWCTLESPLLKDETKG